VDRQFGKSVNLEFPKLPSMTCLKLLPTNISSLNSRRPTAPAKAKSQSLTQSFAISLMVDEGAAFGEGRGDVDPLA
jgi:hypothetical protein